MTILRFTVDSALLRELGERLVGRPHIALAELIKNSYDADASLVDVSFGKDRIEVTDDGSGMTATQFEDFWMRIGSTHKAQRDRSDGGRALTGSKGVGRLAAQFLGAKLVLETAAASYDAATLRAEVDWDRAADSGDLTQAHAEVDFAASTAMFADGAAHGTRLIITRLRQDWSADAIGELGQELWALQPPFATRAGGRAPFRVDLHTPNPEAGNRFRQAMEAILLLWEARIVGRLVGSEDDAAGERHIHVEVHFDDGERVRFDQAVPLELLRDVSFEIRVFRLQGRQKYSIPVEDARSYFRAFGGVHLFDAGFRLPYYGPDSDWLGIEQDHAHRLSVSQLLPPELQVDDGLNFLPTNSRLYGVVDIDTGAERRTAKEGGRPERDALTIQVSRDRLVDNPAYRELVRVVRTAMDFYSTRAAKRAAREHEDMAEKRDVLSLRASRIDEVLEDVKEDMPPEVYERLTQAVADVSSAADASERRASQQASLLGALASAGIATIALEHESARELAALESLARRLRRGRLDPTAAARQLEEWVARTRSTRQLFRPLLDEESREEVGEFPAREVLTQVADRSRTLLRGLDVSVTGVPRKLLLPPGRLSEWSALWQNVLINAANANSRVRKPRAAFEAATSGRASTITLSDTGTGVYLDASEKLFEPFVRRSEEKGRIIGTGGTGLGLTIVRMIATNLDCEVRFVEPADPFHAAFRLSWRAA